MKTIMQYLIPAIFLSAAFAGGIFVERMHMCPGAPMRDEGRSPRLNMLEEITHDLDLSPEQRKQVGDILHEQRDKLRSIRSEVHPRFETVRNETQQRIAALLNPEQLEKFNELKDQKRRPPMLNRLRDRFFHGDRPHDGPADQ